MYVEEENVSHPETSDEVDFSAWSTFGLSDNLVSALVHNLNFTQPTEIQRECLLPAIRDKLDILGAAETVNMILHHFCLIKKNSV